MNIEEIREYCIAKPGVTEDFPFGGAVLVFKVMNKIIIAIQYTLKKDIFCWVM